MPYVSDQVTVTAYAEDQREAQEAWGQRRTFRVTRFSVEGNARDGSEVYLSAQVAGPILTKSGADHAGGHQGSCPITPTEVPAYVWRAAQTEYAKRGEALTRHYAQLAQAAAGAGEVAS